MVRTYPVVQHTYAVRMPNIFTSDTDVLGTVQYLRIGNSNPRQIIWDSSGSTANYPGIFLVHSRIKEQPFWPSITFLENMENAW